MKTLSKILLCIVLVVGILGVAYAQFSSAEKAIRYRKAVMVLIGQHFGLMGAVVKGKQPFDRDQFLDNAKLVATFCTLPWEAFMFPGSDKGDTRLKSAAFKDKDKFMAAAHDTQTQAAKLAEVAKGGDLKAIKSQFGMVGKTCGGCHKPFRS